MNASSELSSFCNSFPFRIPFKHREFERLLVMSFLNGKEPLEAKNISFVGWRIRIGLLCVDLQLQMSQVLIQMLGYLATDLIYSRLMFLTSPQTHHASTSFHLHCKTDQVVFSSVDHNPQAFLLVLNLFVSFWEWQSVGFRARNRRLKK